LYGAAANPTAFLLCAPAENMACNAYQPAVTAVAAIVQMLSVKALTVIWKQTFRQTLLQTQWLIHSTLSWMMISISYMKRKFNFLIAGVCKHTLCHLI